METEQKLIDRIERYLRGELSNQESLEFDELCAKNPTVRNKLMAHRDFTQCVVDYGRRRQLVSEMEMAHQQLDMASIKKTIVSPTFKVKVLWNKYRINMAIAASVAIFAVTITLISTGYFSKSGSTNYSVLRREVNNLKRSQNALIKNMNGKSSDSPTNPGRFGGTGFAISRNGYIITNNHVVQGADSVYVQNMEGQSFKVKLIYVDPTCDLAVLQIVDPRFKSFASLPYSFKKSSSDPGEDVFTIGFPDEKSVYGKGYLSSRTGYAGDTLAYQVSIPVNPGNSGGPLLDSYGNVIGIISGKQTHFDGAAFAIKSKFLLKSLETISQDALDTKLVLSKKNMLAGLDRKDQIKKLQNYIFMVKAY